MSFNHTLINLFHNTHYSFVNAKNKMTNPNDRLTPNSLYTVFDSEALGKGLTNAAHTTKVGALIKTSKDGRSFEVIVDPNGSRNHSAKPLTFNGMSSMKSPAELGLLDATEEEVKRVPGWQSLVKPGEAFT
ncbi:MAG: hypothetical protein AAF549_08165 [Pseudomonadota bacterium]